MTNEERQRVQNELLTIQRDPSNGKCIGHWLAHPSVQVQFFGAQCLLVRINRDWDALEEEDQIQLQRLVSSALTQPTLTSVARNKLEEALVKVMEKAFLSCWWKDPIGDLLMDEKVNFNLLALIPSLSGSDTKKSYSWHHEIKSKSDQILNVILTQDLNNLKILDCIRNWTSFGAFDLTQIQKLLPALIAALNNDQDDLLDSLVDCLVEICEIRSKDPAEEAKKANFLLPACLLLATRGEDADLVTKLTSSLAEECASFLVQSCHVPEIQSFLVLLLKLTNSTGIVGSDEFSSEKTLNAWYLLTESIDADLPSSNKSILVALLGNSLVPVLLAKATLPPPQIWSKIQRDLQQNFLQLRREFLDTLLYIQRALTVLGSSDLLLEIIFSDLKQLTQQGVPNSKAHVETRLRALMIVAEEADSGEESMWTTAWQNLTSLVFTSPELTKDPINAKLAVSLVGSLLPLMTANSTEDVASDAVKMLLSQLQGNALVREECLGALQQAADAEVPLLSDPQIISTLLGFLATWNDSDSRTKLLRLLSRLVSDLTDESQRWNAFNALIKTCMVSRDFQEWAQVLKTPFNFPNIYEGPSPYAAGLAQLKQTVSIPTGEALLAAWTALSGSNSFHFFEGHMDPWPLINSFLTKSSDDPVFPILGSKLLAAWVYGMSRVDPLCCSRLLESISIMVVQNDPHEDSLEAILDAWIHFIKQKPSISGDSHVFYVYNWTLERISIGQLSVPLLRSLARFTCILLEYNHVHTPEQIFTLLQVILSSGISGKIGRSGMEILARPAHDVSLLHPDLFRSALNQIILNSQDDSINLNDRRAFLRNLGAAHTIKKFKTVLVDFCLQSRGIQ